MKDVFVSVILSLCVLPSVSYSDNIMMTIARDKIFNYMKSLREGNHEGCYDVRRGVDAYGERKQKKIKKAMKKTFKSTYENGDNILHLIVRLEQSNSLKEMGDYRGLIPDIKLAYDVLGSRGFLKLLNQKNDKGVSPAQEAANSEGLAYEALQDFIIEYSSSLRPGFLVHGAPALALIIASTFLLVESGFSRALDNAPVLNEFTIAGAGLAVLTGGLCYNIFKRAKDFNTASESLSLPERTYSAH